MKFVKVFSFVLALSALVIAIVKSSAQEDFRYRRVNGDIPQDRILEYKVVGQELHPVLINGEVLDRAVWRQVVSINTAGSGCTGTLVGPKVVITASHCGENGGTTRFTLHGGTEYQGTFKRSSLYPGQDHDVAVAILSQPVPKASVGEYVSVSATPLAVGDRLYLMGYGCTQPGGGGGSDGNLRGGFATVSGFSGFDVVSNSGAALCFGDSGGPGMVDDQATTPKIITVNSKGNIRDTNYTANLASNESRTFLQTVASENNVVICGITPNAPDCSESPDPPDPDPIDCDLNERKRLLYDVAACFGLNIVLPTF